ncbi:DUF2231 domain-containing protein [Pontibacter locisalis]|uniref:DUF2231 domain-containing protein n=1 Tax=Pontibacter locisalis TaxID=1719035 RepID=A0ABW5IGF2_9BACT
MKKNIILSIITLFSILIPCSDSFAHGGEKHGKKSKTEALKSEEAAAMIHDTVAPTQQNLTEEEHVQHVQKPSSVHADLADFPNQHPLFVHFPIVLLLVAAAVQMANVFFVRKELDWITTFTVLISFVSAYYVTFIDHPHTDGLTEHAKLVLEQHDLYAIWTIYLAGAALAAQFLNQFLLKGRRWSIAVVAIILAVAAYSVSMAGHYGAQLVYLEGIGPQGKYLDSAHSH